MSSHPRRPARHLPAAEWWAPLLVDVAAIQRGSAPAGLCVRDIDLSSGTAELTVQWPGRADATLLPDPEAGRAALLRLMAAAGPVEPAPEDHDSEFWVADTPLLSHAWLLDELGRRSDAWYAYLPQPVELLGVATDGRDTATVSVARLSRDDVVRVRVALEGLGSDGTDAGLAYTIVEHAHAADPATLPTAGVQGGRPVYVSTLP
ncbi:hypothetical protein [Streptomyces sp. NPDC046261]|uniref:hypothetical protein n=1 Tax=Streptomyces sp. NPDC046261 TaxID=3157200 RepID=UPI0033FC5EA5